MPLRQQTAAAECSSRSSTAIDPVYKKVHNVKKIIKKKIMLKKLLKKKLEYLR